jgi:hypothetical protein
MSDKTKSKDAYPFEKKKKLAARISDMRNKDHLRKIRDIIFSENPGINAKKNSGGYLMYFQNYTDDTYYKIEKYLNKIERDKLEKQTKSIQDTSDQLILSSEDPNVDYNVSRTRLRYSNRERRLIKRRQYENIINEKILGCENEHDNEQGHDNDNDDNNQSRVLKNSNIIPDEDFPETKSKVQVKKISTTNDTNTIPGVKRLSGQQINSDPSHPTNPVTIAAKPSIQSDNQHKTITPAIKKKIKPDTNNNLAIFSKNRN